VSASSVEEHLDLGIKVFGACMATALGAVSGLYEAFYTPLRLPHSSYLPLSFVAAIVLNPALSWATGWVTGKRVAAVLPALAWCAVFFIAASRTREGDLLITGDNWAGLITLLGGPIAFALGVFVPVMIDQNRALKARAGSKPAVKVPEERAGALPVKPPAG